ncbi:MAG: hypothetical protein U9Q96_01635 [Patescibacteria group bacterium]|nr:hypothetical protein [Patescibacteria group bacterium]
MLKKIGVFIWIVEFLGLAYILGGIHLHFLIVPEPQSELYFHNAVVGVVAVVIILTLVAVLVMLFNDPGLAVKHSIALFVPSLILSLMGFLSSTGRFGGSILEPRHFMLLIPISLYTLGLIYIIGRERA